jgi:hypothetical protein
LKAIAAGIATFAVAVGLALPTFQGSDKYSSAAVPVPCVEEVKATPTPLPNGLGASLPCESGAQATFE